MTPELGVVSLHSQDMIGIHTSRIVARVESWRLGSYLAGSIHRRGSPSLF